MVNEMLKSELEDVKVSYGLLIDGIEIFETKLKENYIPYYSIKGEMDKVTEAASLVSAVKLHLKEINALREKWKALVKEDITEEEIEEQEDLSDAKDAVERTNWVIDEDNIRIETMRKDGNSSYPNIIPIKIFLQTTDTILDQFEKYNKTFFKKSGIASLMKEKIVNDTNYKKSPDTVVYSVVKVLLKENLLRRNQNYSNIK
ncbi:MAG: hypothetical protein PWP27_2429 [Clostridiales bacterium]|nr:hypothetical protein [Clostridiales bacterium]